MADLGASTAPRPLRVLVVDSHSQSRKAAVGLLESCDYKVTAVATAKEALALLAVDPAVPKFDLLLKDHHPAAGVNACRMLAKLKNSAWANLPVVVCSDQDSRAEVLKCVNLGAADYLVKPLRRNEIRNLWTRVPVLVALFSENGAKTSHAGQRVADPAVRAKDGSPSGSGDTTREDEENPTSKEGSAPGVNGNNARQLQGKAGNGSNGDGSNGNDASATTPAHGSNNGQGASTTHVYAAGSGYPAVNCNLPEDARPIVYAAQDGSGDGDNNGSGQGSGSGNRGGESAAARDADPGSHQATPHAAIKRHSSNGNGSSEIGNGAFVTDGAASVAQQQRQQPHQQQQQEPGSDVLRCRAVASGAQGPAAPGSAAAADACRGFRAWVSPRQTAPAAAAAAAARPVLPPSSFASGAHAGAGKVAPTFTELLAPAPSGGTGSVALPPSQGTAATPSERHTSGGTGTGVSAATQLPDGGAHGAHPCLQAGSNGISSVHLGKPEAPLFTQSQQVQHQQMMHAHQQQQHTQQLRQQEAAAAVAAQQWAGGPAAQAHMQRLHAHVQQQQQQHMSAQMLANFAPGTASLGALPPHMLPPAMNPFAFGMRPPRPVSRDDMPLPYGEHHLMQNGAQRMQAQQQAAVAKQAEMQQQLGAAMLASYPGYLLPPYAMASFGGMRPPPSWPAAPSAVQAQQQQQMQGQQQHHSHPPQFAQSAQTRTPSPATLLPPTPGAPQHMASNPAASAGVGTGIPGPAGCGHSYGLPPSTGGTASMQGGPGTSGATNMTSGAPGSSMAAEPSHKERRAQALHKYKQKRKNLCFTKKIRYESRKQLAQARPRIKGQFVRMPSGSEADMAEAAPAAGAAEDVAPPSGHVLQEVTEISEDQPADTASPSGVDAAVGADIMADAEEDAEYDKDGCDFEDEEDVPDADGELPGSGATTTSTATAEAGDTEGLMSAGGVDPAAQRASKGHNTGAALHVSAGGVVGKPHTAHVTTAAAHAARQAKAHAAETRRGARNGSDSGSNSPDEDGIGPEV